MAVKRQARGRHGAQLRTKGTVTGSLPCGRKGDIQTSGAVTPLGPRTHRSRSFNLYAHFVQLTAKSIQSEKGSLRNVERLHTEQRWEEANRTLMTVLVLGTNQCSWQCEKSFFFFFHFLNWHNVQREFNVYDGMTSVVSRYRKEQVEGKAHM